LCVATIWILSHTLVGELVGAAVGAEVGLNVGGTFVGCELGELVGSVDGAAVGAVVGAVEVYSIVALHGLLPNPPGLESHLPFSHFVQ
jgi:hypothetical protein